MPRFMPVKVHTQAFLLVSQKELTEFASERVLSSETVLSKLYSARFLMWYPMLDNPSFYIRVRSNNCFESPNFGDVIWGLVGLFRCLLQKTCSVLQSCVCADQSCTVQCSQLSLGKSGSGGWYPESATAPAKGSIEPQKVPSNPLLAPEMVL